MSNSFIQHDAVPRQASNNKTATINTNKHTIRLPAIDQLQ